MTDQQTIEKFFQSLNTRNLDQMGDLLAETAEFYFPKTQPLLGRERIPKFFRVLFRQYPKLSFRVQDVIAQGQKATVHWTNEGLNKKNERYTNEGVTVLEMDGEQIRFISDFFKDTGKF